jgi:hypothetical protein
MPGLATDGQVYVDGLGDGIWDPVPFDVGELFAGDGLGARVRYADWSSWTGASLPTPTSCPKFTSFSICGANCGPCGAGAACTGRSPAHEYGVCLDNYASLAGCDASQGWSCPSGQSCMVFRVASADQPYADRNGLCLEDGICQSIATSYPGGAYCHGPGG